MVLTFVGVPFPTPGLPRAQATLDFVASLPGARFYFYVASAVGDGPVCRAPPNATYAERVDCADHGSWNWTNAQQLMEHTAQHSNGHVLAATGLGTEPRWLSYGYRKSGYHLADDNLKFSQMVKTAFAKHGRAPPLNAGPTSNQRQDCDQNIGNCPGWEPDGTPNWADWRMNDSEAFVERAGADGSLDVVSFHYCKDPDTPFPWNPSPTRLRWH